ncbi:MAG: hypothetical protein K1X81_13880 [Bacteroidia bacterium]|nr:hypothetical protein [Bacteroidia bacterium]
MKRYLTGIFLLLWVAGFATEDEIDANTLRTEYYYCVSSAAKTDALYRKLISLNSDKPIITGFIGALEGLKAKHAWNPYAKLEYLDKSAATFAKAIAADPLSVEIRFLRYTVEFYVPAFLGYSTHLTDDKRVIIQNIKACRYSKNDRFIVEHILNFMEEHKACSAADLVMMRNVVKQCTPTY